MELSNDAAFELCKAILQLVFADFQASEEETSYVRRLGHQLQLNTAQLAACEVWLSQQAPLPAPDFTVLKAHSGAVLKCAADVIVADGKVLEDERTVLQQLAQMLT